MNKAYSDILFEPSYEESTERLLADTAEQDNIIRYVLSKFKEDHNDDL